MARLTFPEGVMAPEDVPCAVAEIRPDESLALLRNLLTQFQLAQPLLPSLKAALRCLEQADGHLGACIAVAELMGEGAL